MNLNKKKNFKKPKLKLINIKEKKYKKNIKNKKKTEK